MTTEHEKLKQRLKSVKVRIVQMDVNDPGYENGEINEDKLYKIYLYEEVQGGTSEHDYDVHEVILSEMTVTRNILSNMHPEIDVELMISHPAYPAHVQEWVDNRYGAE